MKISLRILSAAIPKMLILTFCLIGISGFSQNLSITGKVTDTEGVTLPGVNIIIEGTFTGTVTDMDGNYAIDVPSETTVLQYSFLGYKNKSETVGSRRVINVSLESDVKALSEFVVVGYGVEKRTLLTGSVSEIAQKQLKDLPVPSIDGVMQGQVAGVQVTQNSGTPGAAMSVRVRGISSIGGSSQPLYVIDGIPVTTGDFSQLSFSGQGVNALSDLNPNDIESITILKDAAAASIYGARASNGVVVITTKRGAAEKTKINFSSYYGIQNAWKTLDMLDARQWMEYRNDLTGTEVFSPEQMNDPNMINTDWQNEIFRTAPTSNIELSAAGGTDKTRFFMSGNLFDQEGILLGTDYRRINGRLNLDHTINDKFTIGTSIGLTHSKTDRVEGDQSLHGVLPNGISTPAIFPVYNADGTYNQDGPYANAVSIGNEYISESFSHRAVANIYADYNILPGLKFSTKWGVDFLNYREHSYESTVLVQGARYNGLGFETYSNIMNLVSNNFLTYNKVFGKHNLEVLGGYSFEKYQTASSFIRGQDFADPSLEYISSASTIVSASASASFSGIRSFFGRANYNYDNKYLLSVSGRLDGSSRFGENNRNGFFPAVSAGWRINEEEFMNVKFISELKLRTSYGLTGNDDIPAFLYAELYGNTSYGGLPAIYPSNIPNPDLKWETTAQFNIGFDLGLFQDRLMLSADYYNKQTKDLLLSRPLPTSSGFSSITQNVGEVENKGIELSITTQNFVGDFTWSTRLNLSGNRNKVLKLYNNEPIDDLGRGSNRIEEGEPIGIFYSYNSLGVDPSTGDIVFEDTNFDGVITAADRTKVGDPHPDFIGGLTNTFGYKGFDLSIFFQWSYGNDVFNGSRLFLESLQGGDNQVADIDRRWRQPGDITDIPRATTDPIAAASNKRVSSRFIEDGSYLRLKNLTFGYTFQNDWQKIDNLRIYFSAQNLLTFTQYSGLDPEVNYRGDDNAVIGTDFFTYPQARTFIVGLNLSF